MTEERAEYKTRRWQDMTTAPPAPRRRTHYDNCWREHHDCAVQHVLDLQREVDRMLPSWSDARRQTINCIKARRRRHVLFATLPAVAAVVAFSNGYALPGYLALVALAGVLAWLAVEIGPDNALLDSFRRH